MPPPFPVFVGLGDAPASGSIYSGGAVPATTQVVYSNGSTLAGDSGFVRSALVLTVDPNTDNTVTLGYGKLGLATSGTSTQFYIAQASNYNSTDYALTQTSAGATIVNGKTGGGVVIRTNNVSKLTVGASAATFASGVPVTISDTTASTTTGTGALIVSGGLGVAGQVTCAAVVSSGNINASGFRIRASGSVTTADATGFVSFWRSGGTIGTAGDMVLQSDLAADANFVFRSGITTPQTVLTIGSAVAAGTTPGLVTAGTSTIAGGVTDGYTTSIRLTPIYNGAFTVTRHDYLDLNTTTGTSTVTDAAVFRFDAAPGTHKALAADAAVAVTFTALGPTGAQTTIQGWMKINVNGTLRYIPFW